jgi:hypothetical protein
VHGAPGYVGLWVQSKSAGSNHSYVIADLPKGLRSERVRQENKRRKGGVKHVSAAPTGFVIRRGELFFYIYDAFCLCPEKMTDRARCWEEGETKPSQAKPSQFSKRTRGLHALRSQRVPSFVLQKKKKTRPPPPTFHLL